MNEDGEQITPYLASLDVLFDDCIKFGLSVGVHLQLNGVRSLVFRQAHVLWILSEVNFWKGAAVSEHLLKNIANECHCYKRAFIAYVRSTRHKILTMAIRRHREFGDNRKLQVENEIRLVDSG